MEKYNQKPIHISEGYVVLDGVRIYDAIKCKITVTPKVMESRTLSSKTKDTRWGNSYDISVEMTRRRGTKWTKDTVRKYIQSGITPEFTICSVQNDKDSDFYASYGAETVTAVGCVMTSAITMLELDADGEFLDDVLTFNAKDVVFN